jgi:hypothetical protein
MTNKNFSMAMGTNTDDQRGSGSNVPQTGKSSQGGKEDSGARTNNN